MRTIRAEKNPYAEDFDISYIKKMPILGDMVVKNPKGNKKSLDAFKRAVMS